MKKNITYSLLIVLCILILILLSNTYHIDSYKDFKVDSTAYVINLDKRPDRWEEIQERFRDSSIKLERVSAIEHPNGHIGCGLSFLKIVQMAKDNNWDTVLIFEDDNKPIDEFDLRWRNAKVWMDNNLDKWEIFNGSSRFPDWGQYDKDTKSSPYENQTRILHRFDENVNMFETDELLSTNWVYINKSAYDKVLKWTYDTYFGIDRYLNSKKFFNVLFIIPVLAMQANSFSDTENEQTALFDKTDNAIHYLYDKILNDTKNNVQPMEL